VTYGRLRYRAMQEGSLLAGVKFFRPDLAELTKLDSALKVPKDGSAEHEKAPRTRRSASKVATSAS
jgi:hypothetical protein